MVETECRQSDAIVRVTETAPAVVRHRTVEIQRDAGNHFRARATPTQARHGAEYRAQRAAPVERIEAAGDWRERTVPIHFISAP
ncbi:MAG: hypothetical protein DMD58_09680 [Gemmatimonadetes bacterium]|nr:MAG: hypothetical protein DMD58_09680 [Gemmatimonadota bacterium]